jgi:hypothetical protein
MRLLEAQQITRPHCFDYFRLRSKVTPTSLKIAAIGACGLWIVTATMYTRGNRARIASATLPAAASISRKYCELKAPSAQFATSA